MLGFGTLMLFHGSFGAVPLPYFFDAAPVWASVVSVPGFFQRTRRATGHTDNPDRVFIDLPTLTGLAVWGSTFVVVLGFAMDAVVARLDPRVRAASRAGR
jgi:ABC-type dipeptide/oligopeptide/nickel transport system permease component